MESITFGEDLTAPVDFALELPVSHSAVLTAKHTADPPCVATSTSAARQQFDGLRFGRHASDVAVRSLVLVPGAYGNRFGVEDGSGCSRPSLCASLASLHVRQSRDSSVAATEHFGFPLCGFGSDRPIHSANGPDYAP